MHRDRLSEALQSMIVIILLFAVGSLLAVSFVGGLNESKR
jgi:hypothetical protein